MRARLLFIFYYIGKALEQMFYNMKMHGKVAWKPKEPKKAVNMEAIIRFDALLSLIWKHTRAGDDEQNIN